MDANPWQEAFLGMSAVLGEPLEESLAALHTTSKSVRQALVTALRSPSREVRARAMAQALAPVAAELERLRLR